MIPGIKKGSHLLIMVALLYALSGCEGTKRSTPVNPYLLKYFAFKKGSYWIYQDSLTGRIDSFAVVESYSTVETDQNDKFDVYDCLINTYHNDTLEDTLGSLWTLEKNEVDFVYEYPPLIPYPNQNTFDFGFFYPLSNYPTVSSYSCGGNTYDSLIEVTSSPDVMLLSQRFGFVKMKIDSTKTGSYNWELQRYSIIK